VQLGEVSNIEANMPQQQLRIFEFFAELLHGWRWLLAREADGRQYGPADVDGIAATLRADLVRLPVLRLLGFDPIRTYARDPEFFRWAQALCHACRKQSECSLIVANAKVMPSLENLCCNADKIRERLSAPS
jgi:hypothetical protein